MSDRQRMKNLLLKAKAAIDSINVKYKTLKIIIKFLKINCNKYWKKTKSCVKLLKSFKIRKTK